MLSCCKQEYLLYKSKLHKVHIYALFYKNSLHMFTLTVLIPEESINFVEKTVAGKICFWWVFHSDSFMWASQAKSHSPLDYQCGGGNHGDSSRPFLLQTTPLSPWWVKLNECRHWWNCGGALLDLIKGFPCGTTMFLRCKMYCERVENLR